MAYQPCLTPVSRVHLQVTDANVRLDFNLCCRSLDIHLRLSAILSSFAAGITLQIKTNIKAQLPLNILCYKDS